jgi:hypothetical protein
MNVHVTHITIDQNGHAKAINSIDGSIPLGCRSCDRITCIYTDTYSNATGWEWEDPTGQRGIVYIHRIDSDAIMT